MLFDLDPGKTAEENANDAIGNAITGCALVIVGAVAALVLGCHLAGIF